MNGLISSNKLKRALVVLGAVSLLLAFLIGRWTSFEAPQLADNSLLLLPREVDQVAVVTVVSRPAGISQNAATRLLDLETMIATCQSGEDFQEVIESIQANTDKTEKTRFLAEVFAAWLDRDPLAALSEVRRVELLRYDAGRVGQAFSRWAQRSPEAAATLLDDVLDGRQMDPSKRPAFLDGIDPPDFVLSLVFGLSQSDPQLAANALADSSASWVTRSGIEVLLQNWYPTDASAAQAWAAEVSDPDTRAFAIAAVATKAGQSVPGAALDWASEFESIEDQQLAYAALTSAWAQRHAEDAFNWAKTLPDGDVKFAVMPDVIRHLALLDAGAAADWLNQYDAAPELDESIAAYAQGIQFMNPQAALGSAAVIVDTSRREAVVLRLAKTWLTTDPVKARSFIESSEWIDEPVRAQLLK